MPLTPSKTFCVLPWTHLHVVPDGKILPCCVGDHKRPLGELPKDTLQDAWNSPGLKRMRKDMLAGRANPACAPCHELEGSGCASLRQVSNEKFAKHIPAKDATAEDGSVAELSMPYMDIRFSNLCNFRCRTCGPVYSSAWYDDSLKLRDAVERLMAVVKSPRVSESPLRASPDGGLWEQLEPLLPRLEEINFAGGEPLMMEEHYRLLDYLIAHKMFGVRLVYTTNFSVTEYRGRDAMALWDRFESVQVRASLDASGSRGEYLRTGQDWSQVVRNRERMRSACPRARFLLAPTLSAMNALHLPDFHAEWIQKGFVAPDDLELNLLLNPLEFRVQVLPAAQKALVLARYEAHVRSLAGFPKAQGEFRGAMDFMTARDLSAQLSRFRRRASKLDALRGESLSAVFPELAALTP